MLMRLCQWSGVPLMTASISVVFQQLAEIGEFFGNLPILGEGADRAVEVILVHVAYRDDIAETQGVPRVLVPMPPQPMRAMAGRSLGVTGFAGSRRGCQFAFDKPERKPGGGSDCRATADEGTAGKRAGWDWIHGVDWGSVRGWEPPFSRGCRKIGFQAETSTVRSPPRLSMAAVRSEISADSGMEITPWARNIG